MSATIKAWLTLMLAIVTLACFSMDCGRLFNSCQKSHSLSTSRFSFTTSGLMIDCVAPVSFMHTHAVRFLLFCCITDIETVGPSLVEVSTCSLVLARFSSKGTPARIVGSSPVSYSLMVRRALISSVVPYSLLGYDHPFHS